MQNMQENKKLENDENSGSSKWKPKALLVKIVPKQNMQKMSPDNSDWMPNAKLLLRVNKPKQISALPREQLLSLRKEGLTYPAISRALAEQGFNITDVAIQTRIARANGTKKVNSSNPSRFTMNVLELLVS